MLDFRRRKKASMPSHFAKWYIYIYTIRTPGFLLLHIKGQQEGERSCLSASLDMTVACQIGIYLQGEWIGSCLHIHYLLAWNIRWGGVSPAKLSHWVSWKGTSVEFVLLSPCWHVDGRDRLFPSVSFIYHVFTNFIVFFSSLSSSTVRGLPTLLDKTFRYLWYKVSIPNSSCCLVFLTKSYTYPS